MANVETPKERSREGGSWLAAGVAVLSVVAFLGWLATRRPPETVAVAEPGQNTPANTDEGGATLVTPEELNSVARVNELRGQDVRIASAEVVAAMGQHLFWVQLPQGSPFLVKLDSTLAASGAQAPSSGHHEIVGRVHEKTEAVLNQWTQSGVLRNENDRIQADFGSSYIEARRVRPAGS